jgi:hypothetical protein
MSSSKLEDSLAIAAAAMARKDYLPAADAFTEAVSYASLSLDRAERRERLFAIFDKRAEAFLRLGDFEAAAGDGLQLCGLRPDAPIGYLRVAEALRGAKRYDEAMTYLRRGADLAGNSIQIRVIMRAVEADIRIARASGEKEPPKSFEVPDASTVGGAYSSPPRPAHDPADESTASEPPLPPLISPGRDPRHMASHAPPLPTTLPQGLGGMVSIAVLVAGVLSALVLTAWIALPLVVAAVVASHAVETNLVRRDGAPVRVVVLGVPLAVWSSGVLCFAITWLSPLFRG